MSHVYDLRRKTPLLSRVLVPVSNTPHSAFNKNPGSEGVGGKPGNMEATWPCKTKEFVTV